MEYVHTYILFIPKGLFQNKDKINTIHDVQHKQSLWTTEVKSN